MDEHQSMALVVLSVQATGARAATGPRSDNGTRDARGKRAREPYS